MKVFLAQRTAIAHVDCAVFFVVGVDLYTGCIGIIVRNFIGYKVHMHLCACTHTHLCLHTLFCDKLVICPSRASVHCVLVNVFKVAVSLNTSITERLRILTMCNLKMSELFHHVLHMGFECLCLYLCLSWKQKNWNWQGVSINMNKIHKEGAVAAWLLLTLLKPFCILSRLYTIYDNICMHKIIATQKSTKLCMHSGHLSLLFRN